MVNHQATARGQCHAFRKGNPVVVFERTRQGDEANPRYDNSGHPRKNPVLHVAGDD
jgi:hypothetical protein